MTRNSDNVIKSAGADQISPFFSVQKKQPSSDIASSPDDPRDTEIVRLQTMISEFEAQTSLQKAAQKKAYEEGFAAGKDAAEAEFDDNREQALQTLAAGITLATEYFKSALARFDTYAVQVAHEALSAMMGDAISFQHIVGKAIDHHVTILGKKAILSIIVSRSDFPDSREVVQAEPGLSDVAAKISVSNDLPAGRCDIKLMLGMAEIDIQKSWSEITKILSEPCSDDSHAPS
jgi:flagellar biosynthesis/type III secretory pathway protein FliH